MAALEGRPGSDIDEKNACGSAVDIAKSPAAQAQILRPYQADIIQRADSLAFAGVRRILIVAATASGKTTIAAAMIGDALAGGLQVLFLAHRRELTGQAHARLWQHGIDAGIIQAGYPSRPGVRVQVASLQTLSARAIRSRAMDLPPADLIIIDEAHHVRSKSYRRILAAYPDARVIGLTATPCRGDGRGLGGAFERLLECPPVSALIDLGYLVPTRVYAPSTPDLTGVRVERGDYIEKDLTARVNTVELVGDVVEHWLRLAQRRRTICFASSVAHSVHLRDEFRRAGVMAEHIDGGTPIAEREKILQDFAVGLVEIVTNCGVLTEGYDCPAAACCILARPTKSLGLYIQMVGRVLRPAPGKDHALILDHAGATLQHGFVDEAITWTLREDQRAENKAQKARREGRERTLATCPECHAIRRDGQPCPACGWRPRSKPQAVEFRDEDLAEIDRTRRAKSQEWAHSQKDDFHRKLLWIARERGYNAGWAAHQYRVKFGAWPGHHLKHLPPLEPDDAIRAWVRSRQIAYAKARARA